MLRFEREAWEGGARRVAGVDEAGRGPLAGPVFAAAVCFDRDWLGREAEKTLAGLTDSKQLSSLRRESFFALLTSSELSGAVVYGIAQATVEEIDRLNILRATHLAMRRASQHLNQRKGLGYSL